MGRKKKHKKRTRLCVIENEDYGTDRIGTIQIDLSTVNKSPGKGPQIPPEMVLDACANGYGFAFGGVRHLKKGYYIGLPQGAEGNIAVIGGNGSGKSSALVKPTLLTWQGAICATDIKGELSDYYEDLYQRCLVGRSCIIFDPMQADGPSYDPFWWLLQDDEKSLVSNIWEIACSIIPVVQNDTQPFWVETERGVLAAALLYFFKVGLGFSAAMWKIASTTLSALLTEITSTEDALISCFLGEAADLKPDTLACIDRGLRNRIVLFATDPYIGHAFRGQREGARCFTWDDLDNCHIFLRVPADRIEQWSGAINLMWSQLIRYLERRPEKYSEAGAGNVQTLLLLDEFARFNKLELFTAAISTLRSKSGNICVVIQSIAQLDKIYGEHDRRIIFDNCQYQAILRANDADTQKYLAEQIGTCVRRQHGVSEHLDHSLKTDGYSKQMTESRDWTVYPHELSTLQDILLLTPVGFYPIKKIQCESLAEPLFLSVLGNEGENIPFLPAFPPGEVASASPIKNRGAQILTIEERSNLTKERIAKAAQHQRIAQRQAQDEQRKQNQRRNYLIGELVARYFPEVLNITPGNQGENAARFAFLEAFLLVLATDTVLVQRLKEQAAQTMPRLEAEYKN